MNSIEKREELAIKLKRDVLTIFTTLEELNIKKYNKSAIYTWKKVFTGYEDRITIFKKISYLKKEIVLYDIDDKSCYNKIIEENNNTIFKVIEEANLWILGELELLKEKIKPFKEEFQIVSKNLKNTIKIYKSLKKIT